MITTIRRKFRDASLFFKISFIICALTFSITVFISVTAILYYTWATGKQNLASVENAVQNAQNTIAINYEDIIERFVSICGTSDFLEDVELLMDPESSDVACELAVQDELSDLASCNFMINSALILSGDGQTYYSLYKNPLRSDSENLITEEELAAADGITWLAERSSPFRSTVSVIPVLFPLTVRVEAFTYLVITDAAVEEPDLYVLLLLDSSKIQTALTASADINASGAYFFLTSEGDVLNASTDEGIQELIADGSITDLIRDLALSSEESAVTSSSGYFLAAARLDSSDLYLLNCVAKESIGNAIGILGLMVLFLIVIVFLILIAISFSVTRFITRPIYALVTAVNQISQNEYQEPLRISSNDETGVLCQAINSMHDTIQLQMKQIKEEEARKYRAQIQLLAEQINPHFLYNTLECIRLEVLDDRPQTASNMIEYLAEYLRIGLSYGDELITVSRELRHAHAYVRIMNERFQQSITFMYRVEPGLEEHLILKTILQPLVENSIRHGFSIDEKGIPIQNPTIEVIVRTHEQLLSLEIIDNGAGFDVKKTEGILYHDSDDSGKHVGLHNVYYRLAAFYGKEQVSVVLDSVSYCRNSIQIRIPLDAVEGNSIHADSHNTQ